MKTISVSVASEVARVTLNRAEKLNAMNNDFWREVKTAFCDLDSNPNVRVVVVDANGKLFSAGLDLYDGPMSNRTYNLSFYSQSNS